MANLVELFDNIVQMQNLNGVPLANGKMYVYALGRTRLMDTWSDVDGESLNSNPIILDAAGQCHCYVSDDFDYTLVVTDAYDNEIFSIDKYLYSQGSHSHADVAVAPSETIAVSSYHVGETTVYVPYLTGQLGKVYEGIDPIVVNNTEDKISANHVPLGVQDPLYFVQDDEEGCIIGFSGQTIPEGVMTESGLGFENDKITGYNGSAFSAGNEYEAGSYVDITDNTISVTGLQPEGDYAYNSALSSKLDVTALPQDLVHSGDLTAYQPAGNYQTAGDYQTAGNYLSASDSANFLQTGDSANFLLTSDSGKFYPMEGNPSGFLTEHQSLDDYATKQWVEDKGYITGVDIPASAGWNEATTVVNNNSAIWNNTTNVVSSNSAQWGASNPQIPVTGINGIKISESGDKVVFEVSGDYATNAQLADKQDSLSYGYHDTAISSIDESALYDNSAHARINTLAGRISDLSYNKLDTSAFREVSGDFLPMVSAGLSASGTYLIDAISNNRILGINTSGISANPNGGVTSVQVGGYNSPEIKIQGYYGTMELNSAGAQYLSSDNSVVWKVGEADHLYVTNVNPDYQNIAIDISQAPRNVDTTRVMIGKNGLSACNVGSSAGINTTYAPATIVGNSQVKVDFGNMHSVLTLGDIYVQLNGNQASSTWHLTGSVQKREIEGDTATSAITAIAGSAIGGVPAGTMNESAFEYDANDKISGYNGSAFAGGSDVPEGVMVESGLEYNAVNEISGYNGSAIAQYGAEKQWLVHDDTLVHASNSAQYALGVNLSAVAQLLGVDETVLWEGAVSGVNIPIQLSESLNNFNKVKFILQMDNYTNEVVYDYLENRTKYGLSLNNMSDSIAYMGWLKLSANDAHDTLTITHTKNVEWNATTTSTTPTQSQVNWEWTVRALTKVIGIGRKA